MKEILITSSVLIVALLVLRLLFAKKVRRTLIYAAWALVALRLLIPVQIGQLDFSVLTAAQPLTETVEEMEELRVIGQNQREAEIQVTKDYIERDQTVFTPEVQEYIRQEQENNTPAQEIATAIVKTQGDSVYVPQVRPQVQRQVEQQTNFISIGQLATIVWLVGVGGMAVWFLLVNLRQSRLLRRSREKLACESPIPVYVSDKVGSPCLVGLLRPVIYLTAESAAKEDARRHVLTHELTHYAHKDHIWSLVRCVCLCVYWFDPLVWVAAWFSRRDCELACDEGALKRLGEQERIAYGKTLLEVVSHACAPANLMQTATAMNETKAQLKERVNFIVKKPKWSIVAAICMVLVCTIVAGCAGAGPANESGSQSTDGSTTTSPTGTEGTTTPIDPNARFTITVHKEDVTHDGAYSDTMILTYNGKGQLLEYQANYRKIVHTYDERGNMLSRMMYSLTGELLEESRYTYNDAGQLIREEGIGYPSDLYVDSTSAAEYSYDDAGNLIYKKAYRDGELCGEYFYAANGNLMEEFGYLGGGYDTHAVYTYTENGKILTKDVQRGGEPYSGEAYVYGEDGRLLRIEEYSVYKGVRSDSSVVYHYDEQGRCVKWERLDAGELIHYEECVYDAAGNMLSSTFCAQNGDITAYRWTYDSDGRMLSCEFDGERYDHYYHWTFDAYGNVASYSNDSLEYTFSYIWPDAQLPANIQADIAQRIAAFTELTSFSPETRSQIPT